MLRLKCTAPALMLAVLLFPVTRQAQTVPFKASIEGVVRENQTGQPIPGASVFLFESSRLAPLPNSDPAVADTQGRFSINVTTPGVYRLLPEKAGLVYSRPARLKQLRAGTVIRVLETGQSVKVDLPMAPEGSITGTILDIATGQPIPSVLVALSFPAFDQHGNSGRGYVYSSQTRSAIRTDDRGEFRLYGLQPGDYYLVAIGSTMGNAPSYYPGGNDEAKATLIHVEEGRETRMAPMMMEPPSRAVQVRLRFTDPSVTSLGLHIRMLGKNMDLGSSAPRVPIPPPREMTLSLSRGPYDLVISAMSSDNDLLYARETFEVGSEEMAREVKMLPGIRIAGSMKLEDANGKSLNTAGIRCLLQSASPVATAQSSPYGCLQAQVSPGHYALDMAGVPPDAYVMSAKSGERDILREGLLIERETRFEIALATPGAVINGKVTNDKGDALSDATVALVPDAPYRNASPLYRVDVSAYDGKFELRGIAPGLYRLFAWSDLQGAAYRNAEFMKKYEERGKPLTIEKAVQISADLIAID